MKVKRVAPGKKRSIKPVKQADFEPDSPDQSTTNKPPIESVLTKETLPNSPVIDQLTGMESTPNSPQSDRESTPNQNTNSHTNSPDSDLSIPSPEKEQGNANMLLASQTINSISIQDSEFVHPSEQEKKNFLQFQQSPEYGTFLLLLKEGVSLTFACRKVRKKLETIHKYSRLFGPEFDQFREDLNEAVIDIAVDCEIRVADKKPKDWLTQGPGRLIDGNVWANPINSPDSQSHDPGTNTPAQLQSGSDRVVDAFQIYADYGINVEQIVQNNQIIANGKTPEQITSEYESNQVDEQIPEQSNRS